MVFIIATQASDEQKTPKEVGSVVEDTDSNEAMLTDVVDRRALAGWIGDAEQARLEFIAELGAIREEQQADREEASQRSEDTHEVPPELESLRERSPQQWGEVVTGVRTQLDTTEDKIALTLDACGGSYDSELIEYLKDQQVPATLFVSGLWLNNHGETTAELAANPLFEIANHGLNHRPCSVRGEKALDIEGTSSVGEAYREIEANARQIETLVGYRPKYYRSGTAYYDEVCTEIAEKTGHIVAGYDVVGDLGASYSAAQVERALLEAEPGSIVVLHMNRPEGETAQGLKKAIPALLDAGFDFVHLSDYALR